MHTYSNPLYGGHQAIGYASASASATQLPQQLQIIIPADSAAAAPANPLPSAILIPVIRSRSGYRRCCTIRRIIICQLLSIILIIAISVGISYFANDRSFKEWDGVVYVVLSAICLIYIFSFCMCGICHYIAYGGGEDDE
jgi:hypothetical protein